MTKAAQFAAREKGATVRTVTMPWPPTPDRSPTPSSTPLGPRTRLAIVDHITAESALVLPLADIAARLRAKGVAVMADGAHAPGAIPFRIAELGVDWYVANLHKWMWVPRSSGILWARAGAAGDAAPGGHLVGPRRGFHDEFDLPGTRDPSPHLAAPAAIDLFHEWGLEAIRALQARPGVGSCAARLAALGHAVRDAGGDDRHDGHGHAAGRVWDRRARRRSGCATRCCSRTASRCPYTHTATGCARASPRRSTTTWTTSSGWPAAIRARLG